jgi:putative transposase
VWVVVVHAASVQDRDGAKLVLERAYANKLLRATLQIVWADGGYLGKLIAWTQEVCGWKLEVIKRSDDVKGFQVVPKRWVVERTFSWFMKYRRMSKDYEGKELYSENMIYVSMIQLMSRRLSRLGVC